MAQPQLNTPNAVGPIRDRDALRVCSLNGIASAEQRVTSLRNLREALAMSIQELENQRRKDQIINKGLLVARFSKATCDAFIDMAATLVGILIGGVAAKEAEFIKAAYGA